MACIVTYLNSAEVVQDCPADEDLFLSVNNENLAVFRTWAKLKSCLGGVAPLPPITLVVGEENAPVDGSSVWQNDDLIGLGSTNNGRIAWYLAENFLTNYGNNGSFQFDNTTGTIDISPSIFFTGDSVYVDRNQ